MSHEHKTNIESEKLLELRSTMGVYGRIEMLFKQSVVICKQNLALKKLTTRSDLRYPRITLSLCEQLLANNDGYKNMKRDKNLPDKVRKGRRRFGVKIISSGDRKLK